MSLIIFPKAFNVGFIHKASRPPPSDKKEPQHPLAMTYPSVSEVSPVPNSTRKALHGESFETRRIPVQVMDQDISVQLQ